MKAIAGVIAGFVAGFAAMALISYIGGIFFPVPVETGASGMIEQSAAALENAPTGAKIFIILSWLGGGLAAGWVARIISRGTGAAWTAVGIVTLLTVANIFIIPFPAWMQIASVALPLLGGFAAMHLPPAGGREAAGGGAV